MQSTSIHSGSRSPSASSASQQRVPFSNDDADTDDDDLIPQVEDDSSRDIDDSSLRTPSTVITAKSFASGAPLSIDGAPLPTGVGSARVVTAIPIFQDPTLAVQAQHERQQLRNRGVTSSSPQQRPVLPSTGSISNQSSLFFESDAGGNEDSLGAADGSFFYSDNRSTPRGDLDVNGLGTGTGLLTRGAAGTAMRRMPDGTLQDQRQQVAATVEKTSAVSAPTTANATQKRQPKPVAAIGTIDDDTDDAAGFQVGVPLHDRRQNSSFSTVATLDIIQADVLEDPLLIAFRAVSEPERRHLEWMNLETFSRGHAVAFATDSEGSRGLQAMITEAFGSIWSYFAKRKPTSHSGRPQKTTLSELASLAVTTVQLQGSERDEVLSQLNGVFLQLVPYILDLSEDPFANYVVQKFLETQSPMFVIPIVQRLRGHCYRMTQNSFACRVLQNIIESCSGDRDNNGESIDAPSDLLANVGAFLRELGDSDHVYQCVLDQNGNHVLQKCLMYLPDHVSFIADRLRDRFLELAQHVYGSRVIQCVFEEIKGPRISFESEQASLRLMVLAFRNIKLLINTQFGNFVVGHALTNSPVSSSGLYPGRAPADPEGVDGTVDRLGVRECLVTATLSRVAMYSRSKYSSNVVQRAVECASTKVRNELTESLLHSTQIPLSLLTGGCGGNGPNRNRPSNRPLPHSHATDFGGLTPHLMKTIPEIGAMMMDPFANYVAQTLINILPEESRERILHEVQPFLPAIVRTHCGKHLINKIAPEMSVAASTGSNNQRHHGANDRSDNDHGSGNRYDSGVRVGVIGDSQRQERDPQWQVHQQQWRSQFYNTSSGGGGGIQQHHGYNNNNNNQQQQHGYNGGGMQQQGGGGGGYGGGGPASSYYGAYYGHQQQQQQYQQQQLFQHQLFQQQMQFYQYQQQQQQHWVSSLLPAQNIASPYNPQH